jgi:hypothetical protein
MALVNGPTISDALMAPDNAIAKLVQETDDDRQLVQDLFLRILNRSATDQEVTAGVATIASATEDEQRLRADVDQKLAALNEYRSGLPAKIAAWGVSQFPPEWHVLDLVEFSNTMGSALTKEADGSWLVTGKNGKGQYEFLAHTAFQNITGIRVEVLADDRLPKKGPGRADDGNLVLTEFTVKAASQSDTSKLTDVTLQNAKATHSQSDFGVEKAIDGKVDDRGWALAPQMGRNHTAIFETKEDVTNEGGTVLSFVMQQNFNSEKHSIGRFRISVTTSSRPHVIADPPQDLLAVLQTPEAERTDAQKETLLNHYRKTDSDLRRLESELNDSRNRVAGKRLLGAQDIAWALINSPAFLFNR